MTTWLILMGVLLPLAPLLQAAEEHLRETGTRRAPVDAARAERSSNS